MVVKLKAVALGLTVAGVWGAIACTHPALAMHPTPNHDKTTQTEPQFRTIEQPLAVKASVTLIGIGLIGAELWWFLLSGKRSSKSNS